MSGAPKKKRIPVTGPFLASIPPPFSYIQNKDPLCGAILARRQLEFLQTTAVDALRLAV